jgi:hypothetical protein
MADHSFTQVSSGRIARPVVTLVICARIDPCQADIPSARGSGNNEFTLTLTVFWDNASAPAILFAWSPG